MLSIQGSPLEVPVLGGMLARQSRGYGFMVCGGLVVLFWGGYRTVHGFLAEEYTDPAAADVVVLEKVEQKMREGYRLAVAPRSGTVDLLACPGLAPAGPGVERDLRTADVALLATLLGLFLY